MTAQTRWIRFPPVEIGERYAPAVLASESPAEAPLSDAPPGTEADAPEDPMVDWETDPYLLELVRQHAEDGGGWEPIVKYFRCLLRAARSGR